MVLRIDNGFQLVIKAKGHFLELKNKLLKEANFPIDPRANIALI